LNKIRPVFSYVGGKFKYIDFIKSILPTEYNNYLEPFLGSASLLLNIPQNKNCIVSDVDELLITYKILKSNECIDKVKLKLEEHFENDSKLYFYKLRQKISVENNIDFVAKYLYLRIKSMFSYGFIKGDSYNGNYEYRKINRKNYIDKIDKFHQCLKDKDIDFHSDFLDVLSRAKKNDLLVIDPPYFSEKKSKDWYINFNKEKQDLLIDYINKLKDKCYIIIFNFKNNDFINNLKDLGFKEIHFEKPYSKFKYEETILINY